MIRQSFAALAVVCLLAHPALAQDARTVVANASKAMGAEGVNSLTIYGSGANYGLGQSNNAQGAWPRVNLNDYRRTIDFGQPASRATAVTWASPATGTPAAQGAFTQMITPAQNTWAQQLEIWITPWGFVRGAAANNATSRTQTVNGRRYHVVTWNAPMASPGGMPYRVVGYINAQTNLVDRVETWLENPIFGDMHVEAIYTEWREAANGFRFPSAIVQRRGGFPTFDAQLLGAEANPGNLADLMAAPPAQGGGGGGGGQGGPQAPVTVSSEKLGEGVFRLKDGYNALAVEFADHIVMYEPGPQTIARAQAHFAEVRRLIPNKPIRYGVVSHHHFDHTSGLPAAVAEGITIVTHELNKAFFERTLSAPRTLAPDVMSQSGRKPIVEGMRDKRVFTDGKRTLEIHEIKGLPHADGMLIAYLPAEKIVFYADMYSAGPNGQLGFLNEGTRRLVANLDRLQLDWERAVHVHAPMPDRPVLKAEIMKVLQGGTN